MDNDYFMQEAEQSTDEQELAMLAEYHYKKTQGFIDYIYEVRNISNGDMLIRAMEDIKLQADYIEHAGLPANLELMI
jgi:hypothetical protein